MRVVGVSPFHDSSVAVYSEQGIELFYKEERLSRNKRDLHPFKSLEQLHDVKNVDVAVICSPNNMDDSLYAYNAYLRKSLKAEQVYDISTSHHLQHASLAFYNSGFEKCLVVVIDRNGSIFADTFRESETVFVAEYPDKITEIYKNFWYQNSSLGSAFRNDLLNYYKDSNIYVTCSSGQGIVKAYESATTLIGQHVLENGKTMGLAAYGKASSEFPELFAELGIAKDEYFFHYNNKWGDYCCAPTVLAHHLTEEMTKANYQIYADWAYHVQTQTQNAALTLIRNAVESTGIKKVCITGGYGLNVVANQFYLESMPDVEFYFEPLADDSGNSLGGAMLLYRRITQDTKISPLKDTFFHGKENDLSGVSGKKANAADIAKLISSGKSVAIYNGLAEAGPRALGNRSILFDPRLPDAKEKVNVIKKREWYRPFAAAVLMEDATKYFDMNVSSSPYMTVSFPANEYAKKVIPGVIHVDGTCRIQTVSKGHPLHDVLVEFKKITGHGVLLNTSFNLAGQPLVETVPEALDVLSDSELNAIWFPQIEKLVV